MGRYCPLPFYLTLTFPFLPSSALSSVLAGLQSCFYPLFTRFSMLSPLLSHLNPSPPPVWSRGGTTGFKLNLLGAQPSSLALLVC